MTRLFRVLAVLGTVCALWLTTAPAANAAPAEEDIADKVRAIPGVTKVSEQPPPAPGFRFFFIDFEQRVDHNDPSAGTFTQRLTLLHRDESRPMVMHTSGYNVPTIPFRSEPAQIVDGNQLAMEHRFFTPSRPDNPNWEKQLTIKQAATDQSVIISAFKQVYAENWLTTGGSKGGMTATYHRRFFPDDVSGTIPYVAPNDTVNTVDSYDEFLSQVGNSAQCRDRLTALQRRVLGNRDYFLNRVKQESKKQGYTYKITGSADLAMEASVVDMYYGFWQYYSQADCATLPDPKKSSNDQVWKFYQDVSPLTGLSDQRLKPYVPYYFQASYQLGSPEPYEDRLRDLLKYPGTNTAPTFVPKQLRPKRFDATAMRNIDRWVRTDSTKMLYLYGGNDPWSAEPFNCGTSGAKRECLTYWVDGGNHGSKIADLPVAERNAASARVRSWAGVGDELALRSESTRIPALDDVEPEYMQNRVGTRP